MIKRGRYPKVHSQDPSLLALVQKLGIQLESTAASVGVALVPIDTVKALLSDKHKVATLSMACCTGQLHRAINHLLQLQ